MIKVLKPISKTVDEPKEKGTKTIKVCKSVYDTLQYVKGRKPDESMTKTISGLLDNYVYHIDCVPYRNTDEQSNVKFIIKSRSGYVRTIPKFTGPFKIIRVTKDVYNQLTDLKTHPEETLNFVIFKLLCSFYQNKPIYRIFTGNCGNCKELENSLKRLCGKCPEIEDIVNIEIFDFNDDRFNELIELYYKRQIETSGTVTMPLSILYNSNGDYVWHTTGYHF